MNKFNKWVIVILVGVGVLLSISYVLSQYIAVKEQNINAITSKRLCYEDLSREELDDCVTKSEDQYINFGEAVGNVAIYTVVIGGIIAYLIYKERRKQKQP